MNCHFNRSRNTSLDVIRVIALFSVISVHFFLKNGFYQAAVVGKRMYCMSLMRTAFMVCVPLFLLLSGYLMSEKKLSRRYYFGIQKTVSIYLLASLACLLYKATFLGASLSLLSLLQGILCFSAAPYSWYVEMYLGLFLLIPFLNALYHGLSSQTQKLLLLATLLTLTMLPSVLNVYRFGKIVPSWWSSLYPLTYYFLGCYLHEFDFKMRKRTSLALFAFFVLLFGSFNYYHSYGGKFLVNASTDWGGFQCVLLSTFLFVSVLHFRFSRFPQPLKWFLAELSDLSFGAYLLSYIFDSYAYPKLLLAVPAMPLRLEFYFLIVPFVFFSSLVLSFGVNLLYQMGHGFLRKIFLSRSIQF